MSRKRWVVSPCDKQLARDLAEECQIDSLVALILTARGLCDPFEVDQLLDDDGPLSDPYELLDMDKAVERIRAALAADERICVYGDYDADGVTSTVMVYSYLKSKGARVTYMVPERQDGYGLNRGAVDRMKQQGVTLMVTVDNGISAVDEIAYATSLGIDTVVTDHHLPSTELPKAVAVVDPHRDDCPSTYKHYAGAGVAFKLLCALEDVPGEALIEQYGDLAAVGTIADLMPLDGENRLLVKKGLEHFGKNHPGLTAILTVSAYKRAITSSAISFTVAPRLNAAGRVGSCLRAVELLLAEREADAEQLAEDINRSNAERQSIERTVFEEAVKRIEQQGIQYDRVIVVCGEDWHPGVIGIVASRICEKYGRPAIVLSKDDDLACGSARSVGDFSLYDAIASCKELLDKFGGHAQAAGVSLPLEHVEAFRERINAYAKEQYGDMPFNEIHIDCKLRLSAFSPDVVRTLDMLAPFGAGNPVPVFGLFSMKLEKITPVSQGKHLRLEISRDGVSATVMAFNKTSDTLGFAPGDIIDLAVTADLSEYMGKEQVTLNMKDIRLSRLNQDKLLRDIRMYERFKRNEDPEQYRLTCKIAREDVETVYRQVRGGYFGNCEKFMSDVSMGYARAMICLDCLQDIGVITVSGESDMIQAQSVPVSEKRDLTDSEIYKRAAAL